MVAAAAISLGCAGYLGALLPLPQPVLVPFLVGILLEVDALIRLEHLGSPSYLLQRVFEGEEIGLDLGILTGVALFGVALNVPRLVRGVSEVLAASKARRAREAARPRGGQAPPQPTRADALPES